MIEAARGLQSGRDEYRIAGVQDPEIKAALIASTERSAEMGNFGAPTMFVEGEMFFGKDKLRAFEEMIVETQ